MLLIKNFFIMLCFLKWICYDLDENVIKGIDSVGKYCVNLRRRRFKLKEEKYLRKCY